MPSLAELDPQVAQALDAENRRQRESLVLIASENYASRAVLESGVSVISNKYAEGYPGRRYYGGCENADAVESLAIERAKELFGAAHANVQPHSGAQANMAAYFALLSPGGYGAGNAAGPRRPPDPRGQGQLFRQAVQFRFLRRGPGNGNHRLRCGGAAGAGNTAPKSSWPAIAPIRG